MPDDKWPFPDARVAGLREHRERIGLFLDLAGKTADDIVSFRLMMAGIYSARAIIELIFEAVDKKQLPTTREELKKALPSKLPWFNLIERIRIHDFHRFGLTPPSPHMTMTFQGGPVNLHARKGAATYTIRAEGPKAITSGDSSVDEQRPLLWNDDGFFDDDTKQYVTLKQILSDFLKAVPAVMAQFEKEILP